ncbi:palmitoyltransferase ZDHHC6 isoform X2 [Cylas formicarius]|uniref:palmitoyltransferase ZDHHC6 isoform X2 n=1 Tax=Cylas formicarius TaxID=197179 RepID=UPI0029589453|nr:palmitoyltransferase ZDHHC6 isoform X2 [Cylas formicarius]
MCFAACNRICHWGPLTAIAIIKIVTGMTIHCSGMWWPSTTLSGFFNTLCFMSLSGLTLYNFLSSMYHGPGYLPLNWMPEKQDCQYLQFCGVCHGYKAPRSHHCRKCGRCVLKMDHHCPWINNCVGWGNHSHFTYFLLFATLGCAHASIVLSCSLYRAIHRNHYIFNRVTDVPIVYLGIWGMILTVLALGFAIGVVAAVGMLLFFQVRSIWRNRTGIEDWILEKANYRRMNSNQMFIFPYDLGTLQNIQQVLNLSCQPIGDGIYWPVVKDCHQYTLTIEQIEQKEEKRLKSRLYRVIKPASGYWFPIFYGFKVCCSYPCTDESRLKLNCGDLVNVTRWRKHWLFGEKIQENLPEGQEALLRQRGWFPRCCVIEVTENFNIPNKHNEEKKIN